LIRLKEEDIAILLLGGLVVMFLKFIDNCNPIVSAHNDEKGIKKQMDETMEEWTKQHISVHLLYAKKDSAPQLHRLRQPVDPCESRGQVSHRIETWNSKR
jgi:hypothetical protein